MNLLETLKKQVGSQLSNLESQIKVLAEKSTEGSLEKAGSSLQKGAITAFGIIKSVVNKGIDTYKEAVTHIDSSDSITDVKTGVEKYIISKGISTAKEIEESVTSSGSTTGVEKYIISKGISTTKEITKGVVSSISNMDTAKSAFESGTHVIKDVAANLNNSGSVTGVEKYIFNKGVETVKGTKEGVDSTSSIADAAKSTLNREKTDNLHASATNAVGEKLRETDVGGVGRAPNYGINADSGTSEKIIGRTTNEISKVADDIRSDTTTLSDVMANATFIEDSENAVNVAKNIAAGAESSSGRSTQTHGAKTIDSTQAMGTTTTTSQARARGLPASIDLDSNSWTARRNSGSEGRSVDLDKIDDAAISDSSLTQDGLVSSSLPKAGKSKRNWVLMPMVFLLGLAATLWWTIDRSGQLTEETEIAVFEPANSEPSKISSVDVDPVVDSSSSSLEPANNSVTTSEVAGLVGDAKSVEQDVVDDALTETKEDNQVVAGISTNSDATTISVAQIESDQRNSRIDSAVRVEQVAMIQKTRGINRLSEAASVRNSQSGSPVEAITTFLESDSDAPPSFTLHGLTFRIASSTITRDSRKIVSDLAATLKAHPTTMIRLEGYTDNRGNAELNQALSASRASAVRTALVNLDLDPARISTQGLGANHPVADNDTKVGRLKNRRVDVIITER
ncbi:MAG: OmpA family protein [Methylococcales bacterium]